MRRGSRHGLSASKIRQVISCGFLRPEGTHRPFELSCGRLKSRSRVSASSARQSKRRQTFHSLGYTRGGSRTNCNDWMSYCGGILSVPGRDPEAPGGRLGDCAETRPHRRAADRDSRACKERTTDRSPSASRFRFKPAFWLSFPHPSSRVQDPEGWTSSLGFRIAGEALAA